jgi:hypothetical protein
LGGTGARTRLVEVVDRTRPAVDLRARADGDDPVALLADLLLALDDRGDRGEDRAEERAVAPELAREVHAGMGEVFETSWALEVGSRDDLAAADERRVLADVAADLLDALLEQKEHGDRASGGHGDAGGEAGTP